MSTGNHDICQSGHFPNKLLARSRFLEALFGKMRPMDSLKTRVERFGRRLAQERHARGLSTRALAKLANISPGQLGNFETGYVRRAPGSRPRSPEETVSVPSDAILERLAAALGVSFYEINVWLGRAPELPDSALEELRRAGYGSHLPEELRAEMVEYARTLLQSASAQAKE